MSRQPTINRAMHSHSSVTVNANGTDYFGVSALNFSSERQVAGAFGTGPNQVGTVFGTVAHTGDFEMYTEDAQTFRDTLGDGYSEVPLTITGTWRETAISRLHTVVLFATIKKDETKSTQGNEPGKDMFELHVTDIIRDGKRLVASE